MYSLGSKIIAYLQKVDNLVNGTFITPVTCEIDPSNYCQNSCGWCIYDDYIKNNRTQLHYSLYTSTVDQLKKIDCKSITFTGGGEPTIHPQFKLMIEYALVNDFKIGLITNGILLDTFSDYWDHFSFIRVSLDASDADTYFKIKGTKVFNKICDNIKKCTQTSITDFGISSVYTTKEEADKFIALGKALGVKYTQIKPIVDKKVEDSNQILNDMDKKDVFATQRYLVNGSNLPCKIAGLIGQVAADGKYYFCCIHRGNPKYCLGDLRTESLKTIIARRSTFVPDLSDCFSCRYMNYAKEYEKVKGHQFQMLRHIDFL